MVIVLSLPITINIYNTIYIYNVGRLLKVPFSSTIYENKNN